MTENNIPISKKVTWSRKLADNAAKNHKYIKIDLVNNKIGSTVISKDILRSFVGNDHQYNYLNKDTNGANVRLAVSDVKDIDQILQNFYSPEEIEQLHKLVINHSNYDEKEILTEINQRCKSHNYPAPLLQLIISGDPHAFKSASAKVIAGDGNVRYLNKNMEEEIQDVVVKQSGFIDQIKEILKTNTNTRTRRVKYINIDGLQEDGSGSRIIGRTGGKLVAVKDDVKYPLVATHGRSIEIARTLIINNPVEEWKNETDIEFLTKNLDKLAVHFSILTQGEQNEEEQENHENKDQDQDKVTEKDQETEINNVDANTKESPVLKGRLLGTISSSPKSKTKIRNRKLIL